MVDDKRRTFLKHLGMVGAAGALGIGVSYLASSSPDVLIDDLEATEQGRGYRKVWATKRDENSNYGIPYSEYYDDALRLGIYRCDKCGYIYDVTDGRENRFDELPSTWVCPTPGCDGAAKSDFKEIGIAFRTGGQPLVNEVVCAYHPDMNMDGKYGDDAKGVFCSAPCVTVCPVTAIKLGPFSNVVSLDDQSKIGPLVDFNKCIRCGRCHKICGYNAIEWVNEPYIARTTGGGL
jgi:rubredoxin/NAD-dependent dihydropyrimidine dehydrogenase PreA subunit